MTIHDIQQIVAQGFGVEVCDLTSRRRGRREARPRQVAMWLARAATPCSLPEIGRAFGNRDHTTVMHAIRQVDERIAADLGFAYLVRTLRAVIAISGEAVA